MTVDQAIQCAVERHQAGDLRSAETLYRQVLGTDPNHVEALHLLGVVASQNGRRDSALELISKAVALCPGRAEYRGNLGLVLAELDRVEEAIAAYRKAIALKPDFAQAHNNLGNVLGAGGHYAEAIESFGQALRCQPNYPDALFNLGNIYKDMGRLDEAVAYYRRALAIQPGWRQAQNNLGNTLCAQGRFDQAEMVFCQALAQRPTDPLAHWNVGLMLLRKGELARGWPEYEWRWQVKELGLNHLKLGRRQWDGAELNGQRIFIHAEQGFGDTIQFIRYIPQIVERGGRVIVGCQPELRTLLRGLQNVEATVTTGDPLPEFEVCCPLPSLAAALATTLATIPAPVPYLHAEAAQADRWRGRFADKPGLKVGLCWAGRPTHPHDRLRSLALQQFAPLGNIAGVSLFSLQKGESARQTQAASVPITDWTEELGDFSETAALIDNLDLVITVDTAVAHLAGAMGKRVWVLLPRVPDWRWMLERTESPWYPTMRLFRQGQPGNWDAVIRDVATQLACAVCGDS